LKKEKEKIKTQIIKSLEAYKENSGFVFFDLPESNTLLIDFDLDDNELPVLQMNLNDSDKILLTTKSLFIRQNEICYKIDGIDIDTCKFMNLDNYKNKKIAVELKKTRAFKSWLYSGDFKIIIKNKTEVVVNLPHHDFSICLFNAIKKLQFVTHKYKPI